MTPEHRANPDLTVEQLRKKLGCEADDKRLVFAKDGISIALKRISSETSQPDIQAKSEEQEDS